MFVGSERRWGVGGGLPTLLFKYTQRYWVTPAGVGVGSVGLD